MTEDTYAAERAELAARLAAIKAEKDKLTDEETHLKELLRKTAFAGPDTHSPRSLADGHGHSSVVGAAWAALEHARELTRLADAEDPS